ncbi:MAG: endonuclease VII domain-containing protein [Candidatus Aenigmarchaeota archaeon]|nr:endonuclease VII domain-containing protein [Candidatus Aenigmarchaeota archaeon]
MAKRKFKNEYDEKGHLIPEKEIKKRKYKDPFHEIYRRDKLLKIQYNISLEQYEEMFERQNGVCAICGISKTERLAIDHDHFCCDKKGSCGKCIRGLLCSKCNTGIAYFYDNIDLLLKAINYLNSFKN